MKAVFFGLIFLLCINFSYGRIFDPYIRRYNLRNATFESLFSPSTIATSGIQALVNTAIQTLMSTSQPFDEKCKSIHQFAVSPTLENLVNFQYELTELCPGVFSLIRHKNISTWGPVEEFLQVWYMRFVEALWQRINAITSTGKCALWDDFVCAAYSTADTVLLQYLENSYDPSLCVANADTMYKWHKLILKPEIRNRATQFLKLGNFSIQLVQAISKAYLTEARYNAYFEGPPFPIVTYFTAMLALPSWTLTEKGFVKQTGNYFNLNFPPLDLAGRQNLFSMKESETIDLSFSYYGKFNIIPLDPVDELFYYHLLFYLCQKDFLKAKQLQYAAAPATTSNQTVCATTTTTTTSITTTTTETCVEPTMSVQQCAKPGSAGIYISNDVVITNFPNREIIASNGTCGNFPHGIFKYFSGNTLINGSENASIGHWDRQECESPCICTDTQCYTLFDSDDMKTNPSISLYPHCTAANDCFVAVVIESDGLLLPWFEGGFVYDKSVQFDRNNTRLPVTDIGYIRATQVSCSRCPVLISCFRPIGRCSLQRNNVAIIFVENNTVLYNSTENGLGMTNIIFRCTDATNGISTHYNAVTNATWDTAGKVAIGTWNRQQCLNPCVCFNTTCYKPSAAYGGDPLVSPEIVLFPHCPTPETCFVATILTTPGQLVNPTNATDVFDSHNQYNSDNTTKPITDSSYFKINSIGCNGCPIVIDFKQKIPS